MAKDKEGIKKIYAREAELIALTLMEKYPSSKIKKCVRCKSKRLEWRLDGARWCKYCGQRIARDGTIILSFDRRIYNKIDKEDMEENEEIDNNQQTKEE